MKKMFKLAVMVFTILTATQTGYGQEPVIIYLTPSGAAGLPDSLYGRPIILTKEGWQNGVNKTTDCGWSRLGVSVTPVDLTPKVVTELPEPPATLPTPPIVINYENNTVIDLQSSDCCPLPVPQDTSWARNTFGPVGEYTGGLGKRNDGVKGVKAGIIFATHNRFANKYDVPQPWNNRFVQFDGELSLMAGSRTETPGVSCDTCFQLIREEKNIVLQAQPEAKVRFGNKGSSIQPFIAGSVPTIWSPSDNDKLEIIPTASAGIIFGTPRGMFRNTGPQFVLVGNYSKYGVGANATFRILFGGK